MLRLLDIIGPGARRAALERFLLFYGVWLLFSEARADFLVPGAVAAALAAAVSTAIWQASGRRLRFIALLGYLPGFLWRSLEGGIDVAWRVLQPRLSIEPAFLRHRCETEDEEERVFYCDALSLMPGTLGAGAQGREVLVHLLSDSETARRQIGAEERRILRLYRRPAAAAGEGA